MARAEDVLDHAIRVARAGKDVGEVREVLRRIGAVDGSLVLQARRLAAELSPNVRGRVERLLDELIWLGVGGS